MLIAILVVAIVIGIVFGASIYIYENSSFYKRTNYSYLTLWTNRDVRNTYKLTKIMNRISGNHKLLYNVKIPVENKQTTIDSILIHESGIYIMDVYHMDGWINGSEQDAEWVQALHNEKINKFENPIINNKRVIFKLREMLPNIDVTLFNTLIVFDDQCSFKKIKIHSLDVDVVKMAELKKYWSEPMGENLSKEAIEQCYNELKKFMDFTIHNKNPQMKKVTVD